MFWIAWTEGTIGLVIYTSPISMQRCSEGMFLLVNIFCENACENLYDPHYTVLYVVVTLSLADQL